MKNTLKKAISALLVAVMVLGTAPLSGFIGFELPEFNLFTINTKAEGAPTSGTCGDNLTWTFDESTGELVINGTGMMYNYELYNDSPAPWYNERSKIKKITIGNYVTSIGDYAFSYCENLIMATIGDSIISIGDWAFEHCVSLTNITIPDSVISIGSDVFLYCKSLINITIPDSVTNIGTYAFHACLNLTSIMVDPSNMFYSTDEYGVLFDKNKTRLIQYPIGNARTDYIIPDSVTRIENGAFSFSENLISITIPDSVISIGNGTFSYCENLAKVMIGSGVTSIGNEAFLYCISLIKITISSSITSIGNYAFMDCSSLVDVYYDGTKVQWNAISIGLNNGCLINATVHFINYIYNLGEETYSFKNFKDAHANKGHCFGMSMTSSAYHIGILDVSSVGGNEQTDLYNLSLNEVVKKPICNYQDKQGSYSLEATVAGGSYYNFGIYEASSDWTSVVNYVKNHEYDNKGTLQIAFRKAGKGGHAVNFLRYEEVNGQARIYVYDNNFPNTETYLYRDENGYIRQSPYSTFVGTLDCVVLRSVPKYFNSVESFDPTRVVYADKDKILIENASSYPMDGDIELGESVVFEIPAGVRQLRIVPLVNNAAFSYLGTIYSFDNITDETFAIFNLSDSESSLNSDFTIVNGGAGVEIRTPSTTTIKHGDGIILHADVKNLPEGGYIVWTTSNGNFSYSVSADGTTCTITPEKSGDTTFTATIYDANGNAISKDEQTMTSKAGFFDKIIAFFKKLFGATKVIPQAFNGIY